MQQSYARMVSYGALILGAIAVVAVAMRLTQGETDWCRSVFMQLARGDQRVSRLIDWPHFQAVGVDVGATHNRMQGAKAKRQYEQMFIEGFAKGFAQAHGGPKDFQDWRVQAREPDAVVVAVDHRQSGRSLLLRVGTSGGRKLEAIQWK